MKWWAKFTIFALALLIYITGGSTSVTASTGKVLGIHILTPHELDDASALVRTDDETWQYLTIPVTLNDLDKKQEWQQFFDNAKQKKMIPLVRLASKAEGAAWTVPTRKDVVDLLEFLDSLEWPTEDRHVIIFNEVNHAKEWGGTIAPEDYTDILRFAADWAHSEKNRYIVLPAAMDLAAPNGKITMEAFNYLNRMHQHDPEIFQVVDAWNSHSYPNPGFSSSPRLTAQNSIRGFEHELRYLKDKTGKDYQVYITETGWVENRQTRRWLESYYTYALQHIWSHPQVVAVTPFVLRGDPGPFSDFTFLDKDNKPTLHYTALRRALERLVINPT
jgi:hypothetical protein